MKRLVLASMSARRKDMLQSLKVKFETVPSNIEEELDDSLAPHIVATLLALEKATFVKEKIIRALPKDKQDEESNRLVVLGADTVVVINHQILGKPTSEQEAKSMLSLLSGNKHEVFSAVAVLYSQAGEPKSETAYEKTAVFMRDLHAKEIDAYIKTGEPLDKAGGYAAQGAAGAFITKLEGCVSNVIGLPMLKTVNLLRTAGLEVLGLTEAP